MQYFDVRAWPPESPDQNTMEHAWNLWNKNQTSSPNNIHTFIIYIYPYLQIPSPPTSYYKIHFYVLQLQTLTRTNSQATSTWSPFLTNLPTKIIIILITIYVKKNQKHSISRIPGDGNYTTTIASLSLLCHTTFDLNLNSNHSPSTLTLPHKLPPCTL